MNEHTATPEFQAPGLRALGDTARKVTDYWWVSLLAGIAWVAASLVILQFDQASVTTVGVLVGPHVHGGRDRERHAGAA